MKKKNIILSALAVGSLFTAGCILSSCDNSGDKPQPPIESDSQVVEKEDITGITFNGATYKYSGKKYKLEIEGNLPSGVKVEYKNNNQVEPGSYEVIAHFVDTTGKYNVPDDMKATLTIEKIEITGISFNDKTVKYTGEVVKMEIEGDLPEGVNVEYTNNENVNAGTHEVTAHFIDNTGHYIVPEDMKATLTIEKIDFDLSEMNFEDLFFTYTGEEITFMEDFEYKGIKIVFSNNKQTQVGNYKVTWNLDDPNHNFNEIPDQEFNVIVSYLDILFDTDTLTGKVNDCHTDAVDIVIPNEVVYYGKTYKITGFRNESVFSECKKLESIKLNKHQTDECILDLSGCTALKKIEVDSENTFFKTDADNTTLFNSDGTKLYSATDNSLIPEGVTSIYDHAFENRNIKTITLPKSLKDIQVQAFANCNQLNSIEIGENVDLIGAYSFANCANLKRITVLNPNVLFGNSCFSKCFNLEYLNIPYVGFSRENENNDLYLTSSLENNFGYEDFVNVKEIVVTTPNYLPNNAFKIFPNVEKITIGDTLKKSYGSGVLNNCNKVSEIVIPFLGSTIEEESANLRDLFGFVPESVKKITLTKTEKISAYAFSHNVYLEYVNLPNLIELGDDSFNDLDNLKEVTFSNKLTTIDSRCFYNCPKLSKINGIDNVSSIGSLSFIDLPLLESFKVPDQIEILNGILRECPGLKRLEFGAGFKSFPYDYADIYDCPNIQEIVVSKKNPYVDSRDNCNAIINTATNKLILGCQNTIIPDSVTEIGMNAFIDGYNIKKIHIPASVKIINDWAFCNLSSCEEITVDPLNENYTSENGSNCIVDIKEKRIIYGCVNTTIPSSVNTVGAFAFTGNTKLVRFTIPDNIYHLGLNSFNDCINLKELNLSKNLLSLSSSLNGCKSLETLELPTDCFIEEGAFFNTGIKTIKLAPKHFLYYGNENNAVISKSTHQLIAGFEGTTIPETVVEIVARAFSGTTVRELVVPSNVKAIGGYAFEGCELLESIDIQGGVTSFRGTFNNCSALKTIKLPGTLKELVNSTFNQCNALQDVYFDGTIEMWEAIQFASSADNPLSFAKNFHYRDADGNWLTKQVN